MVVQEDNEGGFAGVLFPSLPPSHLGRRNNRHISGDEGGNLEQVPPRILDGDAMQNEVDALESRLEKEGEGGREEESGGIRMLICCPLSSPAK